MIDREKVHALLLEIAKSAKTVKDDGELNLSVEGRLHEAEAEGISSQELFECVTAVVAHIRLRKVEAYGEGRYKLSEPRYDLAMCFSDLERKMLRLRKITFGSAELTTAEVGDSLSDTAADIAAYGLLLFQVVVQHRLTGTL